MHRAGLQGHQYAGDTQLDLRVPSDPREAGEGLGPGLEKVNKPKLNTDKRSLRVVGVHLRALGRVVYTAQEFFLTWPCC